MMTHDNPKLKLAFDFVQYTNRNIFLTGKAGTGKTTFLKNLVGHSHKRMIVVAPTGVAAINAGGVTIHSFFQLPFGPQLPVSHDGTEDFRERKSQGSGKPYFRFNQNKINLIRSLDLLVIDEISMVRADLLDAIDFTLRRFRDRRKPFGGVQLLMIGDLQQLAPVVTDEDRKILEKVYDSFYFFGSHTLKRAGFISIELTHIYRQSDQLFIDLLNKVRDNRMAPADLELLNSRFIQGSTDYPEGYIILTTHNNQAKRINDQYLEKLSLKVTLFECRTEGDFPEISFPADDNLQLKTGAQVMFLRNDPSPEKRYYNGKIGKVVTIKDDRIGVLCPGEPEPIWVERAIWENTRFRLNEKTMEVEEEVIGKFIQFPLKLAWAITIHKSQGLTFDKAVIDARNAFAHGQVYVALSRCRSFEGLILGKPLSEQSVINDDHIVSFTRNVEQNQPGKDELELYRKEYEKGILFEMFDFKPILNQLNALQKLWNENFNSLDGTLKKRIREIQKYLAEEILVVAERFHVQLKQLSVVQEFMENNSVIQERIKKACVFFLDRLESHVEIPLRDSGFESDNKELKKRVLAAVDKVVREVALKREGLKSATNGFSICEFLKARAMASMEKNENSKIPEKPVVETNYPELYRILSKWRRQKAAEAGMDEQKILRHKVMVALANDPPDSAGSLKKIPGLGNKKLEFFGQELLSLIMSFRKDNGLKIPENAQEEVTMAGLGTKELSFTLFKVHQSVEKVAEIRKMSASTIYGHLTGYAEEGLLDVYRLIDKTTVEKIRDFIRKNPQIQSLSEIRKGLGEGVDYGEIRMVMAIFKN